MAKGMNLQDSFLNQVRKDNTEIQLILLDGAKLQGTVRGFDNFTVILGNKDGQHLIYKHAIAQIVNSRPNNAPRRESSAGERTNRRERPNRDARPPRNKPPEKEKKPEGFNTLNLSRVVVSEETEA